MNPRVLDYPGADHKQMVNTTIPHRPLVIHNLANLKKDLSSCHRSLGVQGWTRSGTMVGACIRCLGVSEGKGIVGSGCLVAGWKMGSMRHK
jgi:hypothetical protein